MAVNLRHRDYAPRLEVCASVSDPGGAINEDRVGYTRDCAWVIDGATGIGNGLTKEPSDAAWFARTVDAALREFLPRNPELPTADILRLVVRHCHKLLRLEADREPADRSEYPCGAIALVRARAAELELTVLGDCRIVYRDLQGAVRFFGSSRIEIFEQRTLGLAARLLRDNPDLEAGELRRRLAPQLRENRQSMNVPGGYWVLSVDEEAINHLDQTVIPNTGASLAIASDGFLRLVDIFHALLPADLLEIRDNAGARFHLKSLRQIEADDPQCRTFLRVKPSDDASIIAIRGLPAKGI
jgi:Protein phosphatase 2C